MSPEKLLIELSKSGFLLYPTRFPEVGCITVMKAMLMGSIPITSKYINSVLGPLPNDFEGNVELGDGITGSFDLGPEKPYNDSLNYISWLYDHWVPAVVAAYESVSECIGNCCSDNLVEHRDYMRRYAQARFSWKRSAERMEALFDGFEQGPE